MLSASPHRPRSGHRAGRRAGALRFRPCLSARHAARAADRLGAGPTSSCSRGPTWSTNPNGPRIRQQVRRHAPQAVWVEARYAPVCLQSPAGQEQPLASLSDHAIAAFCGIGNPAGFRRALARLRLPGRGDARVRRSSRLHGRRPRSRWPTGPTGSTWPAVVCTQKDLVKITGRWHGQDAARRPDQPFGNHGRPRGI